MFDYQDPYAEEDCVDCQEKEQTISEVIHWFEALLDLVYSKEPLDEIEFETCLDEIAGYLGMKLPEGKVLLVREHPATTTLNQILDTWKIANNQYLRNLTYNKGELLCINNQNK